MERAQQEAEAGHRDPGEDDCHCHVSLIKCVMQELDESGGYSAVEVVASADCGAGGIIQMRQVSDDICHYASICPSDHLAVVKILSLVFDSPSCR